METSPSETIKKRGSQMKKVIFASVFAIGLAACGGGGGGDKAAQLTKLCMAEEDSNAAECECMSNAAVEKLDGDMVDMLLKAAKSDGDSDAAMAAMMGDLTPDQMGKFMTFAMEAGTTCGVE